MEQATIIFSPHSTAFFITFSWFTSLINNEIFEVFTLVLLRVQVMWNIE
jgi:hypothetical protein